MSGEQSNETGEEGWEHQQQGRIKNNAKKKKERERERERERGGVNEYGNWSRWRHFIDKVKEVPMGISHWKK